MSDSLPTGYYILGFVPIILVATPYLLLIKFRKQGLSTAVHYAFRITLGILLAWGLLTLFAVLTGDSWHKLIYFLWMYLSLPAAAVSLLLCWSIVVLMKSGLHDEKWQQHLAGTIVGIVILSSSLYFYREKALLPSARNINTEEESLRGMANGLWAKYDTGLLIAIAGNKSTPEEVLQQLAKHKEYRVRLGVCANRSTPAPTLDILANDYKYNTRYCVAAHPNISQNLLAEMSKDENFAIRNSVAKNIVTPLNILDTLSKDANKYVRGHVAGNNNTPEKLLIRLASDDEEYVRTLVARRANTTHALRMKLANDSSIKVRKMLLFRSHNDAKILNILKNDSDDSISRDARYRLKFVER